MDRSAEVVGPGGKEYRAAIAAAFDGTDAAITFPFPGLPIGTAMSATKRATTR
jgi:hypothetical protein